MVSEDRLLSLKTHIHRMVSTGAVIEVATKSVSFWFAAIFPGLLSAAAMVIHHIFWLNRHLTRGMSDPKGMELSPGG